MQIQPRHEIMEAWRALARYSHENGRWHWSRDEARSSIADAEQLLCILAPATEVSPLRLGEPAHTAQDVREALCAMGDNIDVPVLLVRLLADYLGTYTTDDGTPVFAGGARFTLGPGQSGEITAEQRRLDVVDSFSVSVTLMLSALGFLQEFRRSLTREDLIKELEEVRDGARRRLTAAMVGLMRSFAVNVFTVDDDFGREQLRRVDEEGIPARQVVEELRATMRAIHARLRDGIVSGSGVAESRALENPNHLFECGWSWGVVRDTETIERYDVGRQPAGVAERAPYLYFTAVALDAIEGLLSTRTRLLGLLDRHQAELAEGLRIRSELTRSFWTELATFGRGRWPLENVPWRTTDGLEHEYYSLLVGGMVVQGPTLGTAVDQRDLIRVGDVLVKLAQRVRVTERAIRSDVAVVGAHVPGVKEPLRGSEAGGAPQLAWTVSDIAPRLMRGALRLAGLMTNGPARDRVLGLAQDTWHHLSLRRLVDGPGSGLWDQPARTFPGLVADGADGADVSWYHTKRVIDCLVDVGHLVSGRPPASPHLTRTAADMLREADHVLQSEYLRGTGGAGGKLKDELSGIEFVLERAHAVLGERPGTAVSWAQDALRRLDMLAAARSAHRGAT
ncbi:SCO2524 family protein [Actinoplanes sp. NPDC051475]|uniref:SCO2524 family protein n=1 Tax=Actinoplanes sp. NPDC051475 TaxID=3157225 RepID=UPI00344DCFA5